MQTITMADIRKDVEILLARAFKGRYLAAFGDDSPVAGRILPVTYFQIIDTAVEVFPDHEVWFSISIDGGSLALAAPTDTNFGISVKKALEEADIDPLSVTLLELSNQLMDGWIVFKTTVNDLFN